MVAGDAPAGAAQGRPRGIAPPAVRGDRADGIVPPAVLAELIRGVDALVAAPNRKRRGTTGRANHFFSNARCLFETGSAVLCGQEVVVVGAVAATAQEWRLVLNDASSAKRPGRARGGFDAARHHGRVESRAAVCRAEEERVGIERFVTAQHEGGFAELDDAVMHLLCGGAL